MLNIIKKSKRVYRDYIWRRNIKIAQKKVKAVNVDEYLAIFDTAINSENMGDYIIQYYCRNILDEIFQEQGRVRVPTQTLPNNIELDKIAAAKYKIICGTNIMTPHIEEQTNWKMPEDLYGYHNIVTLGVGWGYYCSEISGYSKFVYNTILDKKYLHSVRDNYTYAKFLQMGINNVVNTGCPTLWHLTENHCKTIPTQKASKVVATITDYDRNPVADTQLLNILREQYENVYVWIQGAKDYEYLCDIIDINLVNIVPRELDAFTRLLEEGDIDYVGTRLHAGIHALNKKVRSLIIAIDNRATEMGTDFNLPIVPRNISKEELIELINSERITDIHINNNEISRWKQQFFL